MRQAQGLNLTGLLSERQDPAWLRALSNRAQARTLRNTPLSPDERLAQFRQMGFNPHGLYLPSSAEIAQYLDHRVDTIGDILSQDERWATYEQLQAETAGWETKGEPGEWRGQQAVARSQARFRIVGCGRRWGKTDYAAHEAMAVALGRPRSTIWVTAPIMKHVARCFDIIWDLVGDLGLKTISRRNSPQEKYIMLENGSRIEGISLENYLSAAGASVNFVIVDEAAQIMPEAWYRAILPPLTDTMGQALLISSWEGEEGFFYEQFNQARKGGYDEWAFFFGESWQNFYMFEKGINSEAIIQAKRNTPPIDFLEQYGAIPAQARNLVYPQFKTRVHVGEYPYDPKLPVICSVDPSKGANEYAVACIQTDKAAGTSVIFDEVYLVGVMAEDVMKILDDKPWRSSIRDVLVDSADPSEIMRWAQGGFPAYAIPDKPEVEMRYPILRRLLRDPARYWPYHEAKLRQLLEQRGLDYDEFPHLPPEVQRPILVDLEDSIGDLRMTPSDIEALKSCSHLFINSPCGATVDEFRRYTYVRRSYSLNQIERGRKYKDHLMDAIGYWAWVFMREEFEEAQETAGIQVMALEYDMPTLVNIPAHGLQPKDQGPEGPPERGRAFASAMRAHFQPTIESSYPYTTVSNQ